MRNDDIDRFLKSLSLAPKSRYTYVTSLRRHLGDTQGRGKLDVLHCRAQTIKSIWIYQLMRDFQRLLCNA